MTENPNTEPQPEIAEEAQAEAPQQEAEASPKAPSKDDRNSKIKALEKDIKGIDKKIVEEKRVIGRELFQQGELPSERAELQGYIQQGQGLLGQRDEVAKERDHIQGLMDQQKGVKEEKKGAEVARKMQNETLGKYYVGVGRAGYNAFQSKAHLQENLGPLFTSIIELDQLIVQKKQEMAELEEQKKQGFFAKIKASVSGAMVKIPGEPERDKVFAEIGEKIISDETVCQTIGAAEIEQVLSEASENVAAIRTINAQITGHSQRLDELKAQLSELKGEQSSAKARLSELDKVVGQFDKQLDELLIPAANVYITPEPENVGRTPTLEEALARLKGLAVERTHAKTQIERLNAENRIEEIVGQREKILQKRHKLAQQIAALDRELADLHEQHVRLHAFVTRVAQGGTVDLADEEKKETLTSVHAAPLEAGKVTNCLGRGRLHVSAGGQTTYFELFGGDGVLFGRSHIDNKRQIRNDWVCRALPAEAPDAANRTRRISKVHGGFRGAPNGSWFVADWSSAGLTVDNAPVEKSGWINLPSAPTVVDLAGGAVVLTVQGFGADALFIRRPPNEGRAYGLIRTNMGFTVRDGQLMGVPVDSQEEGFNLLFKNEVFGISPRGGAVAVNGQALEQPQMLAHGMQISCGGLTMQFEAMTADTPAL